LKIMSTSETQPAEPKPGSRRFQFSLRALFSLTCGTAAFFSLARTLGYVDAVVILAAIVVVVGVMEYPRRVHLATGILLTVVAGLLLWANLRPTRWEKEFGVSTPDQLDPVAKSMFCRGWPLSPCLICIHHHMTVDPSDPAIYLALTSDGIVFVAALFVTRGICGLCFRRRGRPIINTLPSPPQPPNTRPLARPRGRR
jgi:hypothetical protein